MTMLRSITAPFASLLIAVAAASVLLAGALFVVAADPIEAQQQQSCPDGSTPAEDGSGCITGAADDNVTTTTSCTQGVLSADGQYCIVPRIDSAPEPAPVAAAADAPIPTFTG